MDLIAVHLQNSGYKVDNVVKSRAFFKDFPVGGGGHFLKRDLSVR